jgi:hypothetical protein
MIDPPWGELWSRFFGRSGSPIAKKPFRFHGFLILRNTKLMKLIALKSPVF